MTMKNLYLSLAASAALVGCSAETGTKAPLGDDFSALAAAAADGKADTLTGTARLLGSLEYGDTSATTTYTSAPRYRAYKFAGQPGDNVDIWVRSNRDAVAWLLNDSFTILAQNDDADGVDTLDSHITAVLTENTRPEIDTYYIVFREYSRRRSTFTVELQGPSEFTSCDVDADCEKVLQDCCSHQGWVAVNSDSTDEYRDSLACPSPLVCPRIAVRIDTRVAQCNNATRQCELIEPADIACGGFVRHNAHQCPEGQYCLNDRPELPDLPGSCHAFCGGIASLPCAEGQLCVDNPIDECDPSIGADCGGVCVDPGVCSYNGHLYRADGPSFPSADGCNTCNCGPDGTVGCTKRACLPRDCRTEGCESGQYCGECRTVTGSAFICLRDGTAC